MNAALSQPLPIRPEVFQYQDFRIFLNDLFHYLGRNGIAHISLRQISRDMELSSHSYLKAIVKGARNLPLARIEPLATALKLSKRETDFFKNLVNFNQAKTVQEKRIYIRRILGNSDHLKANPLRKELHSYLSNWFCVIIRELVAQQDFQADPNWIASQLRPRITAKQAENAFDSLLKLGLVVKLKNGKYSQAQGSVNTGAEIDMAQAAHFHRQMIEKGWESIERFDRSERDISAMSMAFSEEKLIEAKNIIQEMRLKLEALADSEKDPAAVFQLNVQLFPATCMADKSRKKKSN